MLLHLALWRCFVVYNLFLLLSARRFVCIVNEQIDSKGWKWRDGKENFSNHDSPLGRCFYANETCILMMKQENQRWANNMHNRVFANSVLATLWSKKIYPFFKPPSLFVAGHLTQPCTLICRRNKSSHMCLWCDPICRLKSDPTPISPLVFCPPVSPGSRFGDSVPIYALCTTLPAGIARLNSDRIWLPPWNR